MTPCNARRHFLLSVCYLRQPVLIRHGHPAAVELHDALTGEVFQPVSYTHLTLPTIYSV